MVYSVIVGSVLMPNIIFGFHDKPTTCNYISALEQLWVFFFLKKTILGISETFFTNVNCEHILIFLKGWCPCFPGSYVKCHVVAHMANVVVIPPFHLKRFQRETQTVLS